MTATESEWQAYLRQMDEHEQHIRAWQPAEPDPAAKRCVESQHRTLAHLRACQETWLEACIAFDQKPNPRLKLLHPWRLFEQKSYELISWEIHLAAYLADRARWKELLISADRQKTGKINGTEHSIESLTLRLVGHEHHHLFTPR
jgi:DinB superfamily